MDFPENTEGWGGGLLSGFSLKIGRGVLFFGGVLLSWGGLTGGGLIGGVGTSPDKTLVQCLFRWVNPQAVFAFWGFAFCAFGENWQCSLSPWQALRHGVAGGGTGNGHPNEAGPAVGRKGGRAPSRASQGAAGWGSRGDDGGCCSRGMPGGGGAACGGQRERSGAGGRGQASSLWPGRGNHGAGGRGGGRRW